ncbi:hypothetical protein KC19_7G141400 [Ceratodon purpureus]|uniref:AAA+ ATPase domain-containing protein n=1 Tax=Ceratodon purpureus TaxID=3225 RepID=A0A8T0HET1_CERPU|nr:hypothetical protein KC19_7G141400 [Ceratodon purpureus]
MRRVRVNALLRGLSSSPILTPPSASSNCTSRTGIECLSASSLGGLQPVASSNAPVLKEWIQCMYKALFTQSYQGKPKDIRSNLAMGMGILLGVTVATQQALAEKAAADGDVPGASEGNLVPAEGAQDTEKVVQQVRTGMDERLASLKLLNHILPPLTIAAKGQQVSVRFPVSPTCDMSHLIVDVVARLGGPMNDGSGSCGNEMVVRAWDSAVARQLLISARDLQVQDTVGLSEESSAERSIDSSSKGAVPESSRLCVLVFEPLIGDYKSSEIEFLKKGYLSTEELDAIVSSLSIASGFDPNDRRKIPKRSKEGTVEGLPEGSGDGLDSGSLDGWPPGSRWKYRGGLPPGETPPKDRSSSTRVPVRGKPKTLEGLEAMGVKIYGMENIEGGMEGERISWDNIAGYYEQKREIEDMVLLALKRPEVYDNIARGTRRKFESNRPRAILFEGPPGTGKTSCARVIASQAGVPLLYVPLEVVMSKYYGESERLLASIFSAGNELPEGAIVFLDEIDSLATTRDSEMHEATRRMLSVLLRQMDGFEQDKRIVVIAATNRKQDLDPALLSRFDTSVEFNLPDESTREEIASQYARHLSSNDLKTLATVSDGMSGRDIHDVCQQAERRWASKVIHLSASPSVVPTLFILQKWVLDCPPLHSIIFDSFRYLVNSMGNLS